jgi:arsenate reductase
VRTQLIDIDLYGITNCDTVKKARAWLSGQQLPYQFHDFKKIEISDTLLKQWLQTLSLDILLNRQGTTWRKLSADSQTLANSVDGAIQIMQTYPSVIKRPVLVIRSSHQQSPYLHVGFKPEQYEKIFSQQDVETASTT